MPMSKMWFLESETEEVELKLNNFYIRSQIGTELKFVDVFKQISDPNRYISTIHILCHLKFPLWWYVRTPLPQGRISYSQFFAEIEKRLSYWKNLLHGERIRLTIPWIKTPGADLWNLGRLILNIKVRAVVLGNWEKIKNFLNSFHHSQYSIF